jgi:DNA polymerase III subunit gamma/tau
VQGPTPDPDDTCHICRAIANGSSLDVVEMDAASQRGIDDIREIRERVVLQPAEGRYKVYILDEAHQLTDAAWNALLKLIEEPPPHLVFVFCTTELAKVLPTVRSRCQTFVFARPRLPDLVRKLRKIADAEAIDVPDAALSLIARSARGAYRDAESTLDQLASATDGKIAVQSVLQLLGAVEEEALFRLCDLVVDQDTAGALVFLEELSEQGQDLGRLVTDLLEHLRHLMLVQHMGEVPDSLPVTEETRERLRAQAGPREMASEDSTSRQAAREPPVVEEETREPAAGLEIDQLREAWQRTILPAVGKRSTPLSAVLAEARPTGLDGDTLTLEFPASASFHRGVAEEPKNAAALRDALFDVTGRKLGVVFEVGEGGHAQEGQEERQVSEDELYELMKETFDAREVGGDE